MRNVWALTRRILQQFSHDPRTVALVIVAPILALWLFSVLLGSPAYVPRIATVALPSELSAAIKAEGAEVTSADYPAALSQLANQEVDAVTWLEGSILQIKVEGADSSRTTAVLQAVQAAVKQLGSDERERFSKDLQVQLSEATVSLAELQQTLASRGIAVSANPLQSLKEMQPSVSDIAVSYFNGSEDWSFFDFFGPVFIGIFIFVFVFITSGMSLVTEVTGGTMERLMATPIKSWQLVAGYSLGFAVVSLLQAFIVLAACIWLIGFPNQGSLPLVVLTTFTMALVSLTLGLLVSALAKTAFQVIQLMILLVVPQILLSGIFSLSQAPTWMQALSACFPISYGADALREVMLRGAGFVSIAGQLAVLWGFIVVFFAAATLSFNVRRTR